MKPPTEETPLGEGRLPNESRRAYRAFCAYRDLGEGRSQDLAWKSFCVAQGKDWRSKRRPTHWAVWSQKFKWVQRAEEYDALIDEERRQAALDRRQERRKGRSEFMAEAEQSEQNLVRQADAYLESAFKNPIKGEIVQFKPDRATGTTTKTTIKPTNFQGVAAVWNIRNKTVLQVIERMHSKEPEEEERIVDRVVWVRAKKDNPPEQDPRESAPVKPKRISALDAELLKDSEEDKEGDLQPVNDSDAELLEDLDEDKAA